MAWRVPEGPYGPEGYPARAPYRRPRGRRPGRGRRVLGRVVGTAVSLAVVGALGFGVLWTATPSVGDATQIAANEAAQHGITYPGPPVPATYSNALIATEDHRYYSEQGVDPVAVVRLIASKITGDTIDQGGATLEQQLAKMLYTPGQSGISPEIKQVVLAYKLDAAYSKAQILNLYAEVAYFGHGYYGLEQASCGYFGHPAADLTPLQGAMLAGAVNAPTYDDPISYPRQAYARLTHVVDRMIQVGDITAEQGKQMLNSSLGVVPRSEAGC